jgi:hypothetical protein
LSRCVPDRPARDRTPVEPVTQSCIPVQIFSDVTLYIDAQCTTPGGKIWGGDTNSVLVDYPGPGLPGNVREVKRHSAVEQTFMRADDPALVTKTWRRSN